MIAPSGSAATATIGNNLPISGLFWGQASGGKGGAKRILNNSKAQTPCYKIRIPKQWHKVVANRPRHAETTRQLTSGEIKHRSCPPTRKTKSNLRASFRQPAGLCMLLGLNTS